MRPPPAVDSTDARVAAIEQAVADGYNVLLLTDYIFAEAIVETVENYPQVCFIAMGVTEYDLEDSVDALHHTPYACPPNLFCADYREEISGYLAGWAAVAEGYEKIGLLFYMRLPERLRLCYGFLQGADAAAAALGRTAEVEVRYDFIETFCADEAAAQTVLDTWGADGTEVFFVSGYLTPITKALAQNGKKLILCDGIGTAQNDETVAEAAVLSVRTDFGVTARCMLAARITDGTWDALGGRVALIGLRSEDPAENELGLALPPESESFTEADYKALIGALYRGELTVSDETEQEPKVGIRAIHDNILK